MNDETRRIELAQWILERNLHWIAAAEVKTGVIVALNTAMLGGLAAAFGTIEPAERTLWANLFTLVSAGCLVAAVLSAAISVLPRTSGPNSSFIFFGRIAEKNMAEYQQDFQSASDQQYLDDCLAQIHRNAEIARDKFKWVQVSMKLSFATVLPWAFALYALIRI